MESRDTVCTITRSFLPKMKPTASHEAVITWLRQANQVAARARDAGHHPFGAVLIGPNGQVLGEQGNIDSVNHAESVLARDAAARFSPDILWQSTLVTTVEPCAMCAGTVYWAHIGRVVYGMTEARLLSLTGSHAETPPWTCLVARCSHAARRPSRSWARYPRWKPRSPPCIKTSGNRDISTHPKKNGTRRCRF